MKYNRIIVMVIIICFCSGINYAQYKNHLNLKQNSSLFIDTTKNSQKLTEKEPALAGFLSFIAPGFALGQLYNGEQGKFITHAIIGVTCLSTFIISAHFIVFDLNRHLTIPVLPAFIQHAGNDDFIGRRAIQR